MNGSALDFFAGLQFGCLRSAIVLFLFPLLLFIDLLGTLYLTLISKVGRSSLSFF